MAGNFGCIGWRMQAAAELSEATEAMLARAEDRVADREVTHRVWRDSSGASMAFHLEGGKVQCVTPFFDPDSGLSRWRVSTRTPTVDASCEHCSGADCDVLDADGQTVTRATVQWLLYRPYAEWLREQRTFELEVVAFASKVSFAATKDAFEAAQRTMFPKGDGKPLNLAEQSFIPSGMLGPTDCLRQRATALFAGTVERAQRLRNVLSSHDFLHARVLSLQGAIDVVTSTDGIEEVPESGHRALVTAWLVGRPVVPPPGVGASWLGRLFQ